MTYYNTTHNAILYMYIYNIYTCTYDYICVSKYVYIYIYRCIQDKHYIYISIYLYIYIYIHIIFLMHELRIFSLQWRKHLIQASQPGQLATTDFPDLSADPHRSLDLCFGWSMIDVQILKIWYVEMDSKGIRWEFYGIFGISVGFLDGSSQSVSLFLAAFGMVLVQHEPSCWVENDPQSG